MEKAKDKNKSHEEILMELAGHLMGQIDRSGEQSAFWMVSVLSKITQANPQMNMVCLMNIVRREMKQSYKEYQQYLRTT